VRDTFSRLAHLNQRRSGRRLYARTLTIAVVMTVGIITLLGAWALASPVGSSPDDHFHLPSIWCAAGSDAKHCSISGNGQEAAVPSLVLAASTCFAFRGDVSAACQKNLTTGSLSTIDWNGQYADYPPVFYRTMNLLVSGNVVASVLAMRFFNALLAACLFLAILLLAPRSIRQAVFVSSLVGSVPLGLFIVASNNPSSWAVLGLSTYWAFLLIALESPKRPVIVSAYLLAGLTALMAAGSRADAAAYIAISTIAVVLLTLHTPGGAFRTIFRARLIPIALVMGLAVLAFLRSAQAGIATGGISGSTMASTMGPLGTLGRIQDLISGMQVKAVMDWLMFIPAFTAGAFGGWGLGWLDTPMPGPVVWTVFPAVLILLFVGLGAMYRGKWFAVALVALLVVALPTWVAVTGGDAPGSNVQPRYIYPLVLVLIGIALTRQWRADTFRLATSQWVVLVVALSTVHSLALHANMRRYLTGTDVYLFDLNANYEWWWNSGPSPMFVWLLGTAAFALLATLALATFCGENVRNTKTS
jgi:hypothetical protein